MSRCSLTHTPNKIRVPFEGTRVTVVFIVVDRFVGPVTMDSQFLKSEFPKNLDRVSANLVKCAFPGLRNIKLRE